jgi:hypothetical protein
MHALLDSIGRLQDLNDIADTSFVSGHLTTDEEQRWSANGLSLGELDWCD